MVTIMNDAVGPNHKDSCDGSRWTYSGSGYNRVKICECGAEDHAPDRSAVQSLIESCNVSMDIAWVRNRMRDSHR